MENTGIYLLDMKFRKKKEINREKYRNRFRDERVSNLFQWKDVSKYQSFTKNQTDGKNSEKGTT